MPASRRPSRAVRTLLFFGLCVALIGVLPASPARAAVEYTLPVDDTTAEFGDVGSAFLLSSLVEQTDEESAPTNRLGGVQLAPIGTLDWKGTADNLPAARNEIRAVAIGRYIFAIGGVSATTFQDTVYRGVVDQTTGAITWGTTGAVALPASQHSIANGATGNYTGPSAGRSNAAVAALVTDATAGSGFIFVIGGSVRTSTNSQTISSRSVLVGTVTNGTLTGWRAEGDGESTLAGEDGMLPRTYTDQFGVSQNLPRGVDGASAFIATAGNGTTYLYIVGGRQIGPNTSGSTFNSDGISRRVIYASVNTGTGDLTWVSNGTAGTFFDIPNTNGELGFFNGALINGRFTGADGATQTAFFYTGGQTSAAASPTYSSRVIKGLVGNDGTLTFPGSAGSGDGALLNARNHHGAVLWDNAIYILAGRASNNAPNVTPESSVSPVNDQRVLTTLTGGGNFQQLADPQGTPPPQRYAGGYVVVPSSTPRVSFVYYIGGTDGSSDSAVVNRATIGEPPSTPNYAESGWYFSAPFRIALGGSQVIVKNVKWRGKDITSSGGDLLVSYRTSTDADCAVGTALSSAAWTETLDSTIAAGFSQDGPNEASLDSGQANCFQYRVQIVRGGDATKTPSLTRLSVVVERPGSADLKFFGDQIVPRRNSENRLSDIEINVTNENLFEVNGSGTPYPTVSADYGDGGSFTLDLFIYPPGVSPSTPAPGYTNDFPSTQYNRATMQINRSLMSPLKQYIVNLNDVRWQWTKQDGSPGTGVPDLTELFPTLGTYTVVAVVDGPTCGLVSTTGCVKETAIGQPGYDYFTNNPAEANNISAQVQINVQEDVLPPTYYQNLPTISK